MRGTHVLRGALPFGLLLFGLGSGAAAQVVGNPDGDLRAVLARRSPSDERTADELVRGLARLGAPAVPALYELATGRGLESLVGEEWVPSAWSCEPEQIPELCALALESAPTAAVLEHLAGVLDAGPTDHEHLVILRVLAGHGSAEGLELTLRSASELGALELLRPRVRAGLRAALSSILRREPRAFERLHKRLDTLEPATREVLVEAIGEAGRKPGMSVLVRMLDDDQPARARVVEAMAVLERARPWDLGGQTMEHCGPLFRSPDPAERALVARMVALLHDLDSVPELLALASDSDALVRRCALRSLADMATLPFSSEVETWESWYLREQAWKEEHWTRLLAALVATQPGPANEALGELTQHPLYRHEAAYAIADCLAEQPRVVALAACVELENLGSRRALPGLVAALEGGPAQLKAAVWRALRRITGQERALSLELWRAWIDS